MDQTDHDLLLTMKSEFGTKLDRVIADVKELKDNVADRVSNLENEKLNKEDAQKFVDDVARIHDGFDKRLVEVETFKENIKGRYAIIATLAVIIITALISYLFHQLPVLK